MIEINEILDKKDVRLKAIEHIKNEVFLLEIEKYEQSLGLTHPKHKEECEAKIEMADYNINSRIEDLQSFLYDYSKDWDLNFKDYGLDVNDIKE